MSDQQKPDEETPKKDFKIEELDGPVEGVAGGSSCNYCTPCVGNDCAGGN